MDYCKPGFPVLHCLLEFAQTHVHWVSDPIQPSHPLLESSSAPQSENISSLALSFLYGPTRTSIHDYWKNNSSEYTKHHVSALTNGNSSQCILSLFYAFMLLNSSSTCAQGHFLYQSAQVQLDPEPKMLISTLCFTFFSLLLFPLYLFFLRLSPPS